ncbi:lytic murein transglycosylase [Pseudonocardia nematodicida]|uniref:Lytic murein transglycosylase n=1 Tax=Pseudonocardia nematodicida TaxID=1206997 RepID=A0ABV1KEB2_9PSEU
MRVRSLLAVLGGLLLSVGLVAVVVLAAGAVLGGRPERVPVDRGAPPPAAAPLAADTDVAGWARTAARDTRIPARTLQAYARAELAQRERTPDCRLSWSTLAGIGRIESRHGTIRGAEPGADGRVDPPIVGIPLDGTNGTRRIADTDGGRLDGDPELDRAVGPMQFLPGTWEMFGEGDPQNVDDAALAAAGYLCSGGRDVAAGAGWWDGVLAYNRSTSYARDVWSAAADYTGRVDHASSAAPQ